MNNYENEKGNLSGSYIGYVLGLIGSTLSFIICFLAGLGLILFENLFGLDSVIQKFFREIVDDIYDEFLYFDTILYSQEFFQKVFDAILKFSVVLFIIILIGFILGILGTIKSWKNLSVSSSSIMIVGGIFSLFCLILPGILLIIGGALNLKRSIESAK